MQHEGEAWPGLPPELGPLVPIKRGTKGTALVTGWATIHVSILMEAVSEHPGSNLGLRLNNFLTLDPEGGEAVAYIERLERFDLLPKTVKWRSVSGRIVSLYRLPPMPAYAPPPARTGIYLPDASLELRTGRGRLALIPPSEAKDGDGIMGRCEWINDPWTTPVGVICQAVLKLIRKHAWNWQEAKQVPDGHRLDFLARHGHLKRVGGAGPEEIEAYLQEVNKRCINPMKPQSIAGIARRAAASRIDSKLAMVKVKFVDVHAALMEFGGPEKRWVRRSVLMKHLVAMLGCTPQNVTMALRRMRAARGLWHLMHKTGGFYKLPK